MAETKQGTTVTMPKLGESVTEGTIAGWFKKVGDRVEKYEPMVEVITDKVNAEVPAPMTGTIIEIVSEEGAIVPVGEAICIIDDGDSAGARTEDDADEDEEDDGDRTVVMSAAGIDEIEPAGDLIGETGQDADEQPAPSRSSGNGSLEQARADRDELRMLQIRSSPVVRRLAEEHDVDLTAIEGSGIGGRVTKADIEAYIERRPAEPKAQPQPAETTQPPHPAPQVSTAAEPVQLMPGDEVIEASPMRRQIAEHMTRSVQTAPHVTVWMEVDMTRVVAYRDAQKDAFKEREGFGLTYLPLITSVVVEALRAMPEINSVWDNGKIIRRKAINIGIAVALEDGLIVPVLKDADGKNIVGLARGIDDLVTRAREGKLTPDDVSGGTFTLNNPGTLGSLISTPIIVQPQAAILSTEAIVKRPVVIDDMIAIRPMMNLSLSVDHRLLDGLAATRFLADVKRRLEEFDGE
ncbi:MAG: dihydrolipoamide acetyltransferase family protein [Chloroflexota bacterium]